MDVHDDSEDPTPDESSNLSEVRVAALLRATGRRPPVSPERAERVRGAALAEWKALTRRRARRTDVWAVAVAAAATIVVALIWIGARRGEEPLPAGGRAPILVQRVEGAVTAREPAKGSYGPTRPLRAGDHVEEGSELATTSGSRAAILMTSGLSVRLDVNTRVRIVSGPAIALDEGALYVDSRGPGGVPGASLEVRTPLASLRNIGTQYEARLLGGSLVVRVRDGKVEQNHAGSTEEVNAGEELELRADGTVARRPLSRSGVPWGWIEAVTPMMEIEGRTLGEFTDWIARERGLGIRFSGSELAASGPSIMLRGSIRDLTLDQALASVLATCGLTYRIEDGFLVIDRAGSS